MPCPRNAILGEQMPVDASLRSPGREFYLQSLQYLRAASGLRVLSRHFGGTIARSGTETLLSLSGPTFATEFQYSVFDLFQQP